MITGHFGDEPGAATSVGSAARLPQRGRPPIRDLFPWFIVGFVAVAIARSVGLVPLDLVTPLAIAANVLTTVSMAALGLGVDVRVVARAGLRVTVAVSASLIVLGVISFGLIRVLAIA